jgi:hypothetical protein
VVKHQQLVRQVEAFGTITIKSSTNFDNMIFLMGSIFIFGSWICEADNKGILQGRLVEARKAREEITLSIGSAKDLAKRFIDPTVSESTQDPMIISLGLMSGSASSSGSNPSYFGDEPSSFPIGLRNIASTLQEINSNLL